MYDDNARQPQGEDARAPRRPDLDDLIFQGEGWLVSDR